MYSSADPIEALPWPAFTLRRLFTLFSLGMEPVSRQESEAQRPRACSVEGFREPSRPHLLQQLRVEGEVDLVDEPGALGSSREALRS